MSQRSPGRRSVRDHLPFAPQVEEHFRWRGEHVSRVEGFTDAVFAFAVTLLVVALEVPHTYEGLLDVVRGFPAFIICFAILMNFWNAHYRYHRRYGLEGAFTRVMTMGVLVLVLFFVYPLKFLFTMLTVQVFGLDLHDAPTLQSREQAETLYVIYGLGFAGIYCLYAIMYGHVLRNRQQMQLTEAELIMTRASFCEYLLYISVCLLSVVLAKTTGSTSLPGFTYLLLGPVLGLNGWLFGRRVRALTPHAATAG